MDLIDEALFATCWLTSPGSSGCGMLVAPTKILTANHVVQNAKHMRVINLDGAWASVVMDNTISDPDNDLALVTLDRPLDQYCAKIIPMSDAFLSRRHGWLLSQFVGRPSKLAVTFNTSAALLPVRGPDDVSRLFTAFTAAAGIEQGYSGSPIVDRKGRVISIVSGAWHAPNQKPQPHLFAGPSPRALVSFIAGAGPL